MKNENWQKNFLDALNVSFMGKTSEEIKIAENYLNEFEYTVIGNLDTIYNFAFDANIDINTRKAVGVYIKKILLKNIKTFSIEDDKLLSITNSLILPLIQQGNTEIILNIISPVLIEIFSSAIFVSNEKLCIDLTNMLLEKINSKNRVVILSLFQILISSKGISPKNLDDIISAQTNFVKNVLFDSGSDVNSIRKALDLLSLMFKKITGIKGDDAKKYIEVYIETFTDKIVEIIRKNSGKETIVCFSNVNVPKTQTAEINSLFAKCYLILSFFIQLTNKTEIVNNTLLSAITPLTKDTIDSLTIIAEKHRDKLMNDKEFEYEIAIYQMFFFLSRVITRAPFYNEFRDNIKIFIFKVIFPFFCEYDTEILSLNEDPAEYYTLLIDSMYDFKLKKIKTVCGYILAMICDKFDSAASNILNFVYQLLNYNMNEIDERSIVNYPLINNNIGKDVVRKYSPEIQIDTCLMFMCVLARYTIKDDNIKDNLRNFLLANQLRLQHMTSSIIQYKICLIYGLLIDDLFTCETHRDFLYKSFSFLLGIVINGKDKNLGLAYQALHSFELIVSTPSMKEIAELIVNEKIQILVSMIPTENIDIFFDLLSSIITYLNIDNNIKTQIIIETLKRFDQEASKSGLKSNVVITKLLKCIKTGVECSKDQNGTVTAVQMMKVYFENMDKIEFADEIAEILFACTLSPYTMDLQTFSLYYEMLPSFLLYLKRVTGINGSLFNILRFIVINDKENRINDPNNLCAKIFSEIITTSFSLIDEYIEDPSPIYTLMLIEIWLAKGGILPEQVEFILREILQKYQDVLLIYKNDLKEVNNTYDSYLIWGYLATILSSFIHYGRIVMKIFVEKNLTNTFFQSLTLLYKTSFYAGNWGQVAIMGLSAMLYDQEILSQNFAMLPTQIEIALMIVERQILELKMINYEENDEKEKDEDDSDEDTEDAKKDTIVMEEGLDDFGRMKKFIEMRKENKNGAYTEDIKVISIVQSASIVGTGVDEFEIFSKAIENLSKFNETKSVIDKFVNEMNEVDKQNFKKILHMRRISLNNGNSEHNVPRLIYKIKRVNK